MSGWGGLFEIVLVLSAVIVWGVLELRGTRMYKKKADDKEKK